MLYYILHFFIILKSLYLTDQPGYLENDFSLKKLFCIKRLDLKSFNQPLILQV